MNKRDEILVAEHAERVPVDVGQVPAEITPVQLLGLLRPCWRCGETSTALVGMIEVGGDLMSEDLVLCDGDDRLELAWEHLPAEARTRWRVGEVSVRRSKTAQSSYLANGCFSCKAIFGAWPIFHEEVPEALATHGTEAFVIVSTIDMPSQLFDWAYDSRWE